MVDSRLQARLTKNYTDAAVGYANASAAAFAVMTQQAINFWLPQPAATRSAPTHRDHLSWFSPAGSRSSAWTTTSRPFFQPPDHAPQLMAMTWAFAPFAMFWGSAMRGPTFAWPIAYTMIAQGVPESVAWPAAQANAAMTDAATAITEQAQQAFSSYQSAGGFAMAHVIPAKTAISPFAALAPMAALWPGVFSPAGRA
jgi:hypothetical protein